MHTTSFRKAIMSPTTTPTEAKKALRQTIKCKLSTFSEEDIAQQSTVAQKAIISLPQYDRANRISIYLSMPTGEARTEMLVRDALGRGKVVFVPYIYKTGGNSTSAGSSDAIKTKAKRRSVMEMLRLRSIEDWDGLERDSWGIPSLDPASLETRENAEGGSGLLWNERIGGTGAEREHEANAGSGGLDMVVVPGVAFDGDMSRLGHGAGFYDSYLSRLCGAEKSRRPFLVGLCLAEQLVAGSGKIPVTDHDWKVDAIAVGDGGVVTSTETV